jgi:polyvinyl alcohol dehydrogenase (cytochrome)
MPDPRNSIDARFRSLLSLVAVWLCSACSAPGAEKPVGLELRAQETALEGGATANRHGHAATAESLTVAPAVKKCTGTIDRRATILSNGFGFGSHNHRNQPSEISSTNVARLELALSHAAVGATGKRGAPAVTEQVIYFSAGLEIVAMDRLSGCTYWSYKAKEGSVGDLLGDNLLRSSTVYLLDASPDKPALVLAGDALGHVYAVDAVTGKLVWERFVGDDPSHHWITGGFQYYGGKLFVPFSSHEVITTAASLEACCTSHGLLRAVNPYSGETIWTYHTTPNARLSPLLENGPSGAGIWGVPAIDEKRNLLYIGTGQNYGASGFSVGHGRS